MQNKVQIECVCEGKMRQIGVRFALILIKIMSSKAVNIMSLSTINKACIIKIANGKHPTTQKKKSCCVNENKLQTK